jgi:hypothetical protein
MAFSVPRLPIWPVDLWGIWFAGMNAALVLPELIDFAITQDIMMGQVNLGSPA